MEDIDVRGAVITLDALHTTRNTALAIRRRHGAHYLFTVKGNSPETFQTLETIDWDRVATFGEDACLMHTGHGFQVDRGMGYRQNVERFPGSSSG